MTRNRYGLLAATTAVAIVAVPGRAVALDARAPDAALLASREFSRPELAVSTGNVTAQSVAASLADREPAWSRLVQVAGPNPQIYIDPRSGTPTNIMAAIPMIPGDGAGNTLTLESLNFALGRPVAGVDSTLVADAITRFVISNSGAIAVDPAQLGVVRASRVTADLWHVRIPQEVHGIPVRHSHLSATLSHGNMVLFGTEMWGNVRIDTRPRISADRALEIGFDYLGGRSPKDVLWLRPRLEIVPFAPPQHQNGSAFTGPVGEGYGHYLAWVFGFRRGGEIENWETLVDAHTGAVLAFEDKNRYESQQIKGGVYPLTSTEICPTLATCGVMQPEQPMPYTNTGLAPPNNFTNAAGVYDFSGGTAVTILAGKFVRMVDVCGAISESTTTGLLDLEGMNGQHDCTTGGASAGNTPASRSGFYELNKLIEVAKGWLPSNPWLDAQITSNMNIADTCNAFYSPANGTINFFRSGGGCRNTGELAAVFDHEWGHALDDNDSGAALSVSSEAYADIAAIYRLRASCVGHGFFWTVDDGCGMTADGTGFNVNESQTGTYCTTNCSGVRDSDWAGHASGAPATALGFVCTHCGPGSGPCGKQTHCSAAPSRQAAWDLVARDLQAVPFSMTREDAFNLGARIFYQGSGNIASWHACACGTSSNGCGATNAYPLWLAADDDDGNLNNGTPHMTAIFAAFDRHGIACATPTPTNSGCAGAPGTAPAVTATSTNNRVDLSWSAVPGASTYRVLRTEGYAGCDFGKGVIGEVTGTTFGDSSVANERPYYYVVQPVGASAACAGPGSACVTATPLPCAGVASPDRSVYNCSDVINLRLADSGLVGAGSHSVAVSSTVETTPEIVTLVESPPSSGRFTGSISTSSAPVARNGIINVAHGSIVTVEYVDASACATPNVTVHRTAAVDCTGQPCTGAVSMDRSLYTCSEVIDLSLVDSDLAGAGSHSVSVSSTVETSPEIVSLVESPPGSGSFAGSIQTTTAPPVSNGLLSVADGSIVTLRYADASACGVPNVTAQDTASFDCAPPVITSVRADKITGSTATIRWDTNEPGSSFVTYGGTTPPGTTTPLDPALTIVHAVPLTGLPECSLQYFSAGSADAFLQLAVADNGGAYFTFEVGADVPAEATSLDPPVPIPTQSPFQGTATIPLQDARTVVDVNVRFSMNHTFVGLARVFLRHPDGTAVTLSNRRGGTGDNFVDTVFDDEATVPIGSGSAPFTGAFRPDGTLSNLDGKSAQGTWKLEVFDDASGVGGTITDFDLLLTVAEPCGPNCAQDSSARLTDSCAAGGSGNGNGFWDDGESAFIRVSLKNIGQETLTGVSAMLTPASTSVAMIDDIATYPDLPRGATVDSDAPHFTAHLPVGFACGAPVQFDIAIHSDQGSFSDSFQVGTAGQDIAAGTATALFENFASGIPTGWTVEDRGIGGGAASTWTTANPGGRTAIPPIASPFLIVDSRAAGPAAEQDERLTSPVLDLSNSTSVTLEFDAFFFWFSGGDDERGDVDVISSLTGNQPVNVFRYENGSSANPNHRTLEITNQAAGVSNVQIQFRYDSGAFDNWWMVDNVEVTRAFPASCAILTCPQVAAPSEVLHLTWDSRTTVRWSAAAGATSYVLYRGTEPDLPKLLTGAIDSCERVATASLTATGLVETPAPGSLYWWLVRASNANGLGPSGSATAGPRVLDSSGICP